MSRHKDNKEFKSEFTVCIRYLFEEDEVDISLLS